MIRPVPLAVALPTPALAAGGIDDASAGFYIMYFAVIALIGGLPAVGFGFFLQGLLRLPNALILLAAATLALFACLAAVYGVEKTFGVIPLFALMVLMFGPFFAWGWNIGIKDARRVSNDVSNNEPKARVY
jgi:hypothetical protein